MGLHFLGVSLFDTTKGNGITDKLPDYAASLRCSLDTNIENSFTWYGTLRGMENCSIIRLHQPRLQLWCYSLRNR